MQANNTANNVQLGIIVAMWVAMFIGLAGVKYDVGELVILAIAVGMVWITWMLGCFISIRKR